MVKLDEDRFGYEDLYGSVHYSFGLRYLRAELPWQWQCNLMFIT
jgi:hypothetical protein